MSRRILSLLLALTLLAVCMPAYAQAGLFGDQDLSGGGSVYGLFANTLPYQRIIDENGCISYVYVNVRPESYISYGNDLAARGFAVESCETVNGTITTVVAGENAGYILKYNPSMSELVVTEAVAGVQDDDAIKDVGYIEPFDPDKVIELETGKKLISNEVLIYAKIGTPREEIVALADEVGAEITGEIAILDFYKFSFADIATAEALDGMIAILSECEIIDCAFKNFSEETTSAAVPNDTQFDSWSDTPSGNNWALEAIHAPEAWEFAEDLSVTKVGVIDSPLFYMHDDLEINRNRTSFQVSEDFLTLDELWEYYAASDEAHAANCPRLQNRSCNYCSMKDHATHVSGIIAAVANNNRGVAGVNWFSDVYWAQLWTLRHSDDSYPQLRCSDSTADIIHCITKMVVSGCRVVNMSFGSSRASSAGPGDAEEIIGFDRAVERLVLLGCDFVLVKAAGNDNSDASLYATTRYMDGGSLIGPRTLVVGSIENNYIQGDSGRTYTKSSFSNFGGAVDIFAPGTNVFSTVSNNDYRHMSGTSMAAPIVAGAVSYLYSLNPDLTYDQVIRILLSSATDVCAHGLETYPVLNLGNAAQMVVNGSDDTEDFEAPEYGYLEGVVVDAQTEELLPSGNVRIENTESGKVYTTTFLNGEYSIPLPIGEYILEFSANGYISSTIHNVAITHGLVQHNVRLHMVVESTEQSAISGKVINALTGGGVANAAVTIYEGIQADGESADPVAQTTSDASGKYSVQLAPGNYTVCITAAGFHPGSASILAIGGSTMTEQNVTITPIMAADEIRIILTWGEYPSDLDSHTYGKTSSSTIHTFYDNKNSYIGSTKYINLDLDDTSSYGPETTTIYKPAHCEYSFYVHDYSNRGYNSSVQMSKSNATVKVYLDGAEPMVFNVPNYEGTVWHVFDYANGVLTPVNEMYYQSSPSSVNTAAN